MYKLVENRSEKGKELRVAVVESIQELIKENDKVVAMEADLGGASKFTNIKKSNPENFIQCGISEANMIGVGCGLSSEGFIPYVIHLDLSQHVEFMIKFIYQVHMRIIQSIFMVQIQDLQ